MTFKIMADFGNVQELLISVAFWPHMRTDICVHAATSEHYAKKKTLSEQRSGRIAVERSVQVSEFVFTCPMLVRSQGRL